MVLIFYRYEDLRATYGGTPPTEVIQQFVTDNFEAGSELEVRSISLVKCSFTTYHSVLVCEYPVNWNSKYCQLCTV